MLSEALRLGFRLANRRLSLIFLDLLWKVIWLVLTLGGFLAAIIWFGSEFRSIEWIDTGNRALNTANAVRILREFWVGKWEAILGSVGLVLVLSAILFFGLEAVFRSRFYYFPPQPRRGVGLRFFVSHVLKWLFLASASLALGAILFSRFFTIPVGEWPELWPDTRGAAFISLVTVGALAFLLTIVDTLVRSDAIELLGTDLFRVTGLVSILIWFEAMIVSACAVSLSAGFLNIASFNSALGMLAATTIVVGLLNVLHSYLLLVRYSAVHIMRQNVIEI
jgi:hypothetical protein